MKEHLIRQFDLIPEDCLAVPINVIGAGAIGGWTILSLAKMGFHDITVWDFDKVSIENMNSQFFRFSDIGKEKVTALADLVSDFTKIKLKTKAERYEKGCLPGIVVCAVDSMEARRSIFMAHAKESIVTSAIIDPRMGAETALLYVFDPRVGPECDSYAKSLYSDANAVAEPCTAKATVYTANLIAGLTVKAIKDIVTKQPSRLKSVFWDVKANNCEMFSRESA